MTDDVKKDVDIAELGIPFRPPSPAGVPAEDAGVPLGTDDSLKQVRVVPDSCWPCRCYMGCCRDR